MVRYKCAFAHIDKAEIDGEVTRSQVLIVSVRTENGDLILMSRDPEAMDRLRSAAEVALREWDKLYGPSETP